MDEQIRDLLVQLVILGLILFAFLFAVKNFTDPEMFFLRYHAKDAGTIVEAMHAAPGEVELVYKEVHHDHQLLLDFAHEDVRAAPLLTNISDRSEVIWRVRQQYGEVRDPSARFKVSPELLVAPLEIDMRKDAKNITFGEPIARCAAAFDSVVIAETYLTITAPSGFTEKLERSPTVQALTQPKNALTTIALVIEDGERAEIRLGIGDHLAEAAKLGCLIQEELRHAFLAEVPVTHTPDVQEQVQVTIILPEMKGAQDELVVRALILALEDYTK